MEELIEAINGFITKIANAATELSIKQTTFLNEFSDRLGACTKELSTQPTTQSWNFGDPKFGLLLQTDIILNHGREKVSSFITERTALQIELAEFVFKLEIESQKERSITEQQQSEVLFLLSLITNLNKDLEEEQESTRRIFEAPKS